jgi:hypothetical protein
VAQLRLAGMDESHIQEASAAVNLVVGFSAYLHGIGYSVDKFKQELDAAVAHIQSHAGG